MKPDENKLWRDTLESVKVSVSSAIYSTWFTQTHLVSLEQNGERYVAEVGCASSFVKSTIETRYYGLVQDLLTKALGGSCDLLLVVKQSPVKTNKADENNISPLFESTEIKDREVFENKLHHSGIRPLFSFENYAVSSSNQMAWAASEAVSNTPGSAYNPLFIWGGVGVGKTHLMNAVGYTMIKRDIDTKIISCTGEDFTNDIVEGIRNKSTQSVRNKYRKLNALFIDDIQFIAGKNTIQEEFFHTFNSLVREGGQIILTSDRPPSEISKLEERLRSRFEAGLIVDIAPPDFELRCAIVQIKTKERGMDLPMDLVQIIAGNLDTARKIEGFLVRLSSYARIQKKDITQDLIESVIGKGMEQNGNIQTSKAGPNDVLDAVSQYYSVGKRMLLGSVRSRSIARPRQVLMYLLRTHLSLPLEEVGRLTGGRDHTTVMHAVEKITQLASNNVQIREDIQGIKRNL